MVVYHLDSWPPASVRSPAVGHALEGRRRQRSGEPDHLPFARTGVVPVEQTAPLVQHAAQQAHAVREHRETVVALGTREFVVASQEIQLIAGVDEADAEFRSEPRLGILDLFDGDTSLIARGTPNILHTR